MSDPEISIFDLMTQNNHHKNGCGICYTFFCPHIQRMGAIYFMLCYRKLEVLLPKDVAIIIGKLILRGYAFLEYPEPPPFMSFLFDKKRPP